MERIVTNQAETQNTTDNAAHGARDNAADRVVNKAIVASRMTKITAKMLGVSRSGYYAWKQRAPSARETQNAALTQAITAAFVASDEIYGAKKICAELRDATMEGHDPRWGRVGKNRIADLMRENGLRGVSRRRGFVVTTVRGKSGEDGRGAPDLVNRKFVASGPNQLWVADITYVPTWEGFVYLAVVIDAWSRRVVGWQIGESLHTQLVLDALNMALLTRKPTGVIHHSDKGCQYTSLAFGGRCAELGVKPSTGSVGDAYDNAMAESFFANIEHELIARRSFKSKSAAKTALFTYIEAWYNLQRRHSGIEYLSPVRFEQKYAAMFETKENTTEKGETPTTALT